MAKSIAGYKHELDKYFNAFIKLFFSEEGYCNCYTCPRVLRLGDAELHCGHFLGKAASPIHRYKENNCRPQCQDCNFNDGERDKFEVNLRDEIGDELVQELIDTRFGDSKFTHDFYREKIKFYKNRVNDLSDRCLGSW